MMKKVWVCDGCGLETEHPNRFRIKEFGYRAVYAGCFTDRIPTSFKKRICLCEDCLRGLRKIGMAKEPLLELGRNHEYPSYRPPKVDAEKK